MKYPCRNHNQLVKRVRQRSVKIRTIRRPMMMIQTKVPAILVNREQSLIEVTRIAENEAQLSHQEEKEFGLSQI